MSDNVAGQLTKSFDGAEAIAQEYPQYASQITAAAKTSFLQGDQWAYLAGIVAVLLGAVVVARFFPRFEREQELLAAYQAEDSASGRPGHPCRRAREPEPGVTTAPEREEPVFLEPRWPIVATLGFFIAISIVLRVAVPNRSSLGPAWLVPAVEVGLLLVLLAADPARVSGRRRWLRTARHCARRPARLRCAGVHGPADRRPGRGHQGDELGERRCSRRAH